MDNGTEVDVDSISIPSLCLSCLKNQKKDVACNITRIDQATEIKSREPFCCFAYEPNDPKIDKETILREMKEYLKNRVSRHEHGYMA